VLFDLDSLHWLEITVTRSIDCISHAGSDWMIENIVVDLSLSSTLNAYPYRTGHAAALVAEFLHGDPYEKSTRNWYYKIKDGEKMAIGEPAAVKRLLAVRDLQLHNEPVQCSQKRRKQSS